MRSQLLRNVKGSRHEAEAKLKLANESAMPAIAAGPTTM